MSFQMFEPRLDRGSRQCARPQPPKGPRTLVPPSIETNPRTVLSSGIPALPEALRKASKRGKCEALKRLIQSRTEVRKTFPICCHSLRPLEAGQEFVGVWHADAVALDIVPAHRMLPIHCVADSLLTCITETISVSRRRWSVETLVAQVV